MSTPFAGHAPTFRAQTCIAPDRMAHLARDISEEVHGGFPRAFIQFDGASPGQLSFSVRTRLTRTALMTFDLDITQRIDGFTSLRSTVCDAIPRGGQAPYLASLTRPLGVEIYRRYTRELASALARFDPLSTAVIVDPGHRP